MKLPRLFEANLRTMGISWVVMALNMLQLLNLEAKSSENIKLIN